MPECAWEGRVYLLQPAVGDAVNGLCEAWRELGAECGFISLEPAKGAGHDHLVELGAFSGSRCQGDLVPCIWVLSGRGFNLDNGLVKADVAVLPG